MRVEQELNIINSQRQKSLAKVLEELSVYGIEVLTLDLLDEIQFELGARRDEYQLLQKKQSDLEKLIALLEAQTKNQIEQLFKLKSDLEHQRVISIDLKTEQELLVRERYSLLGDQNPNQLEINIGAEIDASEKVVEELRHSFHGKEQERVKLHSALESIEKTIITRDITLKEADLVFKTHLKSSDFLDESSYLKACLSETQRRDLMLHAQKLENEFNELETKKRDNSALLEVERHKQITSQPQALLIQERNDLNSQLKELQQSIGAIKQQLEVNDNLREKQKERVEAIDRQKREYLRWDLLHGLIGSSDGKKFRNFAQGLTFEMMIGHANRQLLKMTDRYLLIRDENQPLELNVVDNDQAGEIRSTKNLSGGESFIVSLSLALGLSQMASKNVRVDSLFLDEGFGTLDEEALDTALETLASLQQSGKLIGVISHVPTLKERISTRIQISRHTGGRSLISGPGCNRLD